MSGGSRSALGHDAAVRELRSIAKRVSAESVASAFVASLGRKPGFWRTPLVALALARALPAHRLGATFSGGQCRECGLRAQNTLEDAPGALGDLLPGDPAQALAVLRAVVSRADAPSCAKEDVQRMTQLLGLVGTLPASARESKLNGAIARSKLVVGNKYHRRFVIETLGACGILETPEHPGFTTRWSSFAARQARPNGNVEPDPPIAFWSAADGVSTRNVRLWLGALGVRPPSAKR